MIFHEFGTNVSIIRRHVFLTKVSSISHDLSYIFVLSLVLLVSYYRQHKALIRGWFMFLEDQFIWLILHLESLGERLCTCLEAIVLCHNCTPHNISQHERNPYSNHSKHLEVNLKLGVRGRSCLRSDYQLASS